MFDAAWIGDLDFFDALLPYHGVDQQNSALSARHILSYRPMFGLACEVSDEMIQDRVWTNAHSALA